MHRRLWLTVWINFPVRKLFFSQLCKANARFKHLETHHYHINHYLRVCSSKFMQNFVLHRHVSIVSSLNPKFLYLYIHYTIWDRLNFCYCVYVANCFLIPRLKGLLKLYNNFFGSFSIPFFKLEIF